MPRGTVTPIQVTPIQQESRRCKRGGHLSIANYLNKGGGVGVTVWGHATVRAVERMIEKKYKDILSWDRGDPRNGVIMALFPKTKAQRARLLADLRKSCPVR